MLFNTCEKKTCKQNNIAGANPLGWWSGRMVACFWATSSRRWDCKSWKAR